MAFEARPWDPVDFGKYARGPLPYGVFRALRDGDPVDTGRLTPSQLNVALATADDVRALEHLLRDPRVDLSLKAFSEDVLVSGEAWMSAMGWAMAKGNRRCFERLMAEYGSGRHGCAAEVERFVWDTPVRVLADDPLEDVVRAACSRCDPAALADVLALRPGLSGLPTHVGYNSFASTWSNGMPMPGTFDGVTIAVALVAQDRVRRGLPALDAARLLSAAEAVDAGVVRMIAEDRPPAEVFAALHR